MRVRSVEGRFLPKDEETLLAMVQDTPNDLHFTIHFQQASEGLYWTIYVADQPVNRVFMSGTCKIKGEAGL